ncbi:MAG: hypothetical protein ABI543_12650 [Ignavibacteria bacterium]
MLEIIIIVLVVGIIVGFYFWGVKGGEKMKAERTRRLENAENGKAKVISSSPIGLAGTGAGGEYQALEFTLEVSNQYKAAYTAKSIWEVYPMGAPKVQTGMEINVKIDAEDNNIIYPVADGIAFSWRGLMMTMAKKM